jgi:hypothetical protein
MEVKWIMIFAVIAFGGLFTSIGVSEYSKGQCQIEGIRAGMTAEDIIKACGKSR